MLRLLNKHNKSARGFTLIEAIIAITLVAFMGTGLLVTLLMGRQMAEYDKQRIAAISAARDYLERARRDLYPALEPVPPVRLDDFNTPSTLDDLHATLEVDLYEVNPDGSRGSEISDTSALTDFDLVEVVVTVEWYRTGSLSSHRVSEVVRTYRTPDV